MNLDNMVVGSDLARLKPQLKKIFFYRICGTGMGACACLAKESGLEVAGADMTFSPPMSTYLESQNIPLTGLNDLTKEDMQQYDLIVVGNSVPRKSDYARFIEDCGVPFTSFPSFLGEFILKDKEVIGLAGTHGKTTTTFFLAQMLESLGEDVGYFIGGIIDGRSPSHLGKSPYFVIESDEYDSCYFQKISKFRLYELNHMILTSLEFDHADIFNSIEDIKNEFSACLGQLEGHVVANDAYGAISDLKHQFDKKKHWKIYGETSELGPKDVETDGKKTRFKVLLDNQYHQFETNVIGTHNILNITACIMMLFQLDFEIEKIQESVHKLGLVKRRQEERGYYQKTLVIDDFAHHPKAITLTTQAIKDKYPDKKIITVFEPISATARSSLFQKEFTESLHYSDVVVMAQNSLQTTVGDGKNLDCEQIVSELKESGKEAYFTTDLPGLRSVLDKLVGENHLFLILSNRTCLGLWESDFVESLT